MTSLTDATSFWLGARRKSKDDKWQWTDGTAWDYQHGIQIKNESGRNCMFLYMNGGWSNCYCDTKLPVVCAFPSVRMSGSHDLVFKKDSLIDPRFGFWWYHAKEKGVNKAPGFRISSQRFLFSS